MYKILTTMRFSMKSKIDNDLQLLLHRFLKKPEITFTQSEEEILSQPEVFKAYTYEDEGNLFDLVCQDNKKLLSITAMKGYLGVIQWLFSQKPELKEIEYSGILFSRAAQTGHLELIKYLCKEVPALMQSAKIKSEVALFASANNHFNIIHYLTTINPFFQNRMIYPQQKSGLESFRRDKFNRFSNQASSRFLYFFKQPADETDATLNDTTLLSEVRNSILQLVFRLKKQELGLDDKIEPSYNLK